jgi:hypothetical protein
VTDDNKTTVFKQPDLLLEKFTLGCPGGVDLEAIERAESIVTDMTGSYLGWAEDDLFKINKVQAELKDHLDQSAMYLDKIYKIAHDMKGQGGSFGYGLMTVLGNDLCRFIEGKKTARKVDLQVINLYIAAMQVILSKRMRGGGGAEGQKVLVGLAAVVERITAGTP